MLSGLLIAQDNETLQNQVHALLQKAQTSNRAERLKLLDNAATLAWNKKGFPYDSIARLTIDQALQLDSLEMAMDYTWRSIFFLTNRAGKPKDGQQLFHEFLEKEPRITNHQLWARIYLNGADSHFFSGDTEGSIAYYETAGDYAAKAQDSILLGNAKNYLSDALADVGRFAESGIALGEAERIFKDTKDTLRLLTTWNSRANLYSRIGFFNEAEEVRKEVIAIATRRKDYRMLQSTYFNASIDDRKTGDFKQRIHHLKQALFYVKKAGLKSYEPKIYSGLLYVYSLTDSLVLANKVLDTIHMNLSGYTQGLDKDYFTEALAHYEFAQGNYQKAIGLGESLFTGNRNTDLSNTIPTHKFLADAYNKIGNERKAFFHFKEHAKLKDSINEIQNVQALSYYQTLYEIEKRDAQIGQQDAEIALLDSKNKVSRQWMLFGGIGLLALFLILYLYRTRQFSRRKQRLHRQFSQDLIKGQEEERFKIARELHDGIGQKLALLVKKSGAKDAQELKKLSGNTLDELRGILNGLHPPTLERLGITKALASLIDEVDENTELFFTYEIDPIDNHLDEEKSLHLYRIVQEAINNILKHAEAKAVAIEIKKNNDVIHALVKDNGKGFDFYDKIRSGKGFGMKTLLERAKIMQSKLFVESEPNAGTSINLTIPI